MSDDWIKHDGTCCPVPVGTWCWRKYADGNVALKRVESASPFGRFGVGSKWVWNFPGACHFPAERIIAYRLPRSRAADKLIERIRNLEPEREPA